MQLYFIWTNAKNAIYFKLLHCHWITTSFTLLFAFTTTLSLDYHFLHTAPCLHYLTVTGLPLPSHCSLPSLPHCHWIITSFTLLLAFTTTLPLDYHLLHNCSLPSLPSLPLDYHHLLHCRLSSLPHYHLINLHHCSLPSLPHYHLIITSFTTAPFFTTALPLD